MCMPGGISRYLGGMVGIQEAATVSQVVNSITTALQAEYAHAVELAGTNMTMKQICAPFSNSIYQNLKTVETTAKIAQEEGLGVAKQAFETVENNPGLVANSGSSVAEAMQKVANFESAKKIEKVLERVKTYEQARNKALELVGNMGNNATPYYGRLSTSKGFGKIIGRVSSDGKVRWYLDYDPTKGMHLNVHDFRQGKGLNAKKYVIPFEGTEETFESLLKHLNR